MSQLPIFISTDERSNRSRITVASLCHNLAEGDTALSAQSDDTCSTGLQCPLPLPVALQYRDSLKPATHASRFHRANTTKHVDTANNTIDSTSDYVSPLRRTTGNLPTTAVDTTQHYYFVWDVAGRPTSTPHANARSDQVLHINHDSSVEVQPTVWSTSVERIPRAARPSYTEEQKFFIMYQRVINELSWPEIEVRFASFFKLRSRDGLTSVYYRIRKDWGMKEVLKSQSYSVDDGKKVKERAAHFSRDFLAEVGFFEKADV